MVKLNFDHIVDCLNSSRPVQGYTHNFYRYPARFSPEFARAVISEFSPPNSYIIDPFMGGGTSIVEALPLGRYAIGVDLNPLAHFVSDVKTTPLTSHDVQTIRAWFENFSIEGGVSTGSHDGVVNLPARLKRFFEDYLANLDELPQARQRRLTRAALLKTGQWALDCRADIPTRRQMADKLRIVAEEMLESLNEWATACHENGIPVKEVVRRKTLLCCSAATAAQNRAVRSVSRPRLLLTSPPYPGVHVLYHRWQVQGRRETPTPYWLSGLNDGNGEAFYTLGGRSRVGIDRYFASITQIFSSIRTVLHSKAYVIQLVAFSQIGSQLGRYLQAMEDAGYTEIEVYSGKRESRVWRRVPNRKWYADIHGDGDAMKEFLFVHRVSKA